MQNNIPREVEPDAHKAHKSTQQKPTVSSTGSDLQFRSSNSPKKLLKCVEEELPKKKLHFSEGPSPMLTCKICLRYFTENSELTQHLLDHISMSSSYQTHDIDTGIKEGTEESIEEKSISNFNGIKRQEDELEESDENEETNEESDSSLTAQKSPKTETVSFEVVANSPNTNQKSSPALSLSSSSMSILETADRTSPTAVEKQEVAVTETPEYKRKKTESRKKKQMTSSSKPVKNNKSKKEQTCGVCQRIFTRLSSLKRHTRIHTGEKPFTCEICHKSFFQSSDLTQHLRVHTGERPFKCTLCTSAFSQLSALSRHMRCHFGEKPYVCAVCQRAFSQSSALYRHACSLHEKKSGTSSKPPLQQPRSNTGEKVITCEICSKSFTRSANLSIHMRVHSGEKPFSCLLCDRQFSVSSNLTRHMKTHKDCDDEFYSIDPTSSTMLTFDSLAEPVI